MLYGTDLNHAFSFGMDDMTGIMGNGGNDYRYSDYESKPSSRRDEPRPKKETPPPPPPPMSASPPPKPDLTRSAISAQPPPQPSNLMDFSMSPPSAEQKIQLLSMELQRHRDYLEHQKTGNAGYLEKLMSKKRDVLKFIMFMLIILLAMSLHLIVKHYYKAFFMNNVLTPSKEFMLRTVYPIIIILLMWNMRVFLR